VASTRLLRLAGPLVNVGAYELVGRVEQLQLEAGQKLVMDVSRVSEMDMNGFAAVQQIIDLALDLECEIAVTGEPVNFATAICQRMLKQAQADRL
jgi:ABC-type transporter Mla MlaB component